MNHIPGSPEQALVFALAEMLGLTPYQLEQAIHTAFKFFNLAVPYGQG